MNEHVIAKAWRQMIEDCASNPTPAPDDFVSGHWMMDDWSRFSEFYAWSILQWRKPTMSRRWSQGTPRFQEEPQFVLTPGERVYCPSYCNWEM